ncbi:MAG: VWA domain-containing protein, partial [Acidobacteria bacterium]|nr:VWA domain-containing protein [Acidobacteriota bacterium]
VYPAVSQERQEKQEKQEKKDEQAATIRLDTDLVSFDVNVTDRKGNRGALGLRAEDFIVYEDGVRQKISNFSTTEVPFNLVLLIDTSASTRDEILLIRRAARRFLDELRLQDRITIIQFSKEVELIANLTSDRFKLEAALNRLKPGSGTSFYDALQLIHEEVLDKVEGRRAIVTLTDGVDSYGSTTFEQVMPILEKGGASAYFLELNTESFTEAGMMRDCKDRNHFEFSAKQLRKYLKEHLEGGDEADYEDHCSLAPLERMQINRRLYQSARRELREMAKRTGGRVYPIKQLPELDRAYTQIASELRTQYSLAYYPSNDKHDGKWRTLRVEIRRPGFIVEARPGYRAPLD